ncbi:uncharacterized protein LOC106869957 [Octopus bimaculoides]|uniref:uncharacterized protein LOC106869957 n=1 Tax=Octopus bimaculoides TaxID=37653 RepID=UPI00071E15F1|nr:uncharacterized protein LOC106869957 [Octopus bimaculoides]|eukprot:XP_014771388.1 PREDICTED: uncharacterized protein LOC106869957 [Octopus bimaculoides]
MKCLAQERSARIRIHELMIVNRIHKPPSHIPSPKMNSKNEHRKREISEERFLIPHTCPEEKIVNRNIEIQLFPYQVFHIPRNLTSWILVIPTKLLTPNFSSTSRVKYFTDHVVPWEGHDRVTANISGETNARQTHKDEIENYINGRYVSASEAVWRILGFKLQGSYPAVKQLTVHLPQQQYIYFNDDDDIEYVIHTHDRSTLTEWMRVNQESPANSFVWTLHSTGFPEFYTWNNSEKMWHLRKNNTRSIGRIYLVSLKEQEQFHLRALLYYIPGVTSFEDTRTINGVVCHSYKEAAMKLGLAHDNPDNNRTCNSSTDFFDITMGSSDSAHFTDLYRSKIGTEFYHIASLSIAFKTQGTDCSPPQQNIMEGDLYKGLD